MTNNKNEGRSLPITSHRISFIREPKKNARTLIRHSNHQEILSLSKKKYPLTTLEDQ